MVDNFVTLDDIRELAGKMHGELPALFMDRDKILGKVSLWRTYLPDVTLSFAVKANSDPLIVELLAREGCYFDVASAYEMALCGKFGVTGERMVLSHPVKTQRTIEAMKVFRPWAFSVDSDDELDRIRRSGLLTDDYHPVLFVRISTPSKNTQDDLSAKFGSTHNDALRIIKEAASIGIKRFGVSFHVGTQCYDVGNYLKALDRAAAVARDCQVDVEWIDIGGGFADDEWIKSSQAGHPAMFRTISQAVHDLKTASGFKFLGEPGRFLVADAGVLAVTVLAFDRDEERGRRLILGEHVYGAFNGQKFDSRFYEPMFAKQLQSGSSVLCDAFGCTCDSVDRLTAHGNPRWYVPNSLNWDDVVLFERMGAYSVTSGASFNGIDPAGAVLVWRDTDGKVQYRKSPFFDRGQALLDSLPVE